MEFFIDIQASREKIWSILWEDKTFRDWANIIDEGTYLVGEMVEGSKVQFLSASSGYGVTSLIEKLIPNEVVTFRHLADTKDLGEQEREPEWTGGKETYRLTEKDGLTTLTVHSDIPAEQVTGFKSAVPKALARIKELAESQ